MIRVENIFIYGNKPIDKKESLKRASVFIIITFFINYLMAFLFYGMGGGGYIATLVMAILYMFIPMTVAIVLQKIVYHENVKDLGISWRFDRWFLIAWLLPPVIALVTFGLTLLMPGIRFSPEMAGMIERFKDILTPEQLAQMEQQAKMFPIHPFWLSLIQGLIAGPTINAVAGFGEELGWRGYLQKYLGFMGFWKSSLLIGLIWGLWHAPLILHGHNYPQHPQLGVFMMTGWTILLAPLFGYVRLKAKSVIAAAVIHGSINATGGLSVMVIKGGNDLTTGVTGVPGFIVLVLVNIILFVYNRYWAQEKVSS